MRISKLKRARVWKALILCGLTGLMIVFGFQNCSSHSQFSYDFASVINESGIGMVVEDGSLATNKKVLAVHFTGKTQEFQQFRLAPTADMDAAGVAWQTFKADLTYDLGDQWAADGSKDGIKTIYAEVRQMPEAPTIPLSGSIGLDTLAPKIESQGLLATGLQGQIYSKGQPVKIQWSYSDTNSPSGYKSNIASKGLRVGYTSNADCSQSVTWLGDWQSPVDHLDNFSWPANEPTDTFYVCAMIKDAAGNVSTMLSQPMTSIWKVFAGDNNQGNGGSVGAANVRFKLPSALATDSHRNLYIMDTQFHTVRKVAASEVDAARTISTFAGNGHQGTIIEGDALQTPLGGSNSYSMQFDSQDRLYLEGDGSIYRIAPDSSGVNRIRKIVQVCGSPTFTIRKTSQTESLVIHGSCDATPNLATGNSYIYEVPLSVIDAQTTAMPMATLLANYILAGNGINPPSSFTLPTSQYLTRHDGSDLKYTVGFPGPIFAGPQGEIYFSTWRDGSGRGWGHHTLRRLTYQNDGSVLEELLSTTPWIRQLAVLTDSATGKASSVLAAFDGAQGLAQVKLTSGYPVAYPFTGLAGHDSRGVVTIPNLGNSTVEIYASGTTLSNVQHVTQSFVPVETMGRPVYREDENIATLAMIGQPEGVVQDPQGNTYFFDSINDVVRKIDMNGAMRRIAGAAGVDKVQNNNGNGDAARFHGLDVFNGSYMHQFAKDFSADGSVQKLYLSNGNSGKVDAIDLVQNTVQTITGLGAWNSSTLNWALGGLAVDPISGHLIMNRYCPQQTGCDSANAYAFTGHITSLDLTNTSAGETHIAGDISLNFTTTISGVSTASVPTGTQPLNAPLYSENTIRIDHLGNMFYSNQGLFMTSLGSHGQPGPLTNLKVGKNSRFNVPFFELVEEGTDRLFFFPSGEKVGYVRVALAATPQPTVSGQTTFCLPGTFLNGVRGFALSKDGNLLISDSANGRILEVFIRNTQGQLTLPVCK